MDLTYVKALLLEEKAAADGQKVFTFLASNDSLDRQGEVVTADGWETANYLRNPVVLDSHRYDTIESIIGRAVAVRQTDKGLEADIQFNETPKGKLAKTLVTGGDLRAVSVGFRPVEMAVPTDRAEPLRHTRKELLEISSVAVPANQDALRIRQAAVYSGSIVQPVTITTEEDPPADDKPINGAMKAHTTEAAPEDADWDEAAEREAADIEALAVMCGWRDLNNPDLKASYRFLHHSADEGHAVNWRGVAGSMLALYRDRDGLSLPESERRAIHRHLCRHYRQFDKTPPAFETVKGLTQLGPEARHLFWEGEWGGEPAPAARTKAGARLSRETKAVITQAIDVLTRLRDGELAVEGEAGEARAADPDVTEMMALLKRMKEGNES